MESSTKRTSNITNLATGQEIWRTDGWRDWRAELPDRRGCHIHLDVTTYHNENLLSFALVLSLVSGHTRFLNESLSAYGSLWVLQGVEHIASISIKLGGKSCLDKTYNLWVFCFWINKLLNGSAVSKFSTTFCEIIIIPPCQISAGKVEVGNAWASNSLSSVSKGSFGNQAGFNLSIVYFKPNTPRKTRVERFCLEFALQHKQQTHWKTTDHVSSAAPLGSYYLSWHHSWHVIDVQAQGTLPNWVYPQDCYHMLHTLVYH